MLKAVIYDFDGTLTPDYFPKFEILEKSGLEGGMYNPGFMKRATQKAKNENLEMFEAMILTILEIIRDAGIKATRDNIALGANRRSYNPGVAEFLRSLQEKGIKNYILSSGAKDYLDQTTIAPYFEKIYASTLKYNAGEATGTELVMTVPQKAKVLEEITKSVNRNKDDCSGLVYIGDGPTDLHAMEFIKAHGGKNILVYLDENSEDVTKMRQTDVVDYFALADFRPNSVLRQLIFSMI